METDIKACPYCKEEIKFDALKCKHCGEILDPEMRSARFHENFDRETIRYIEPKNRWNPGIAALLSLVIPGAGQMYKGNVGAGIAWLIFVIIGYSLFIFPGIILHLICVLVAASGNPNK